MQTTISTVHALEGGVAHAAVITQSPEVKTTKKTQPQSHGKQTNTKTTLPHQLNNLYIRSSNTSD
jgi:hypothetical protein